MTAKEILSKVKALFDAPLVAPVAPVVPAAAAVPPAASVGTPFKLKDGTEISVTISDPTRTAPAAGDTASIAGTPAPAADYELEDGTTLTVDATGAITVVTPAAPITQTPEQLAEAARVAALAQPTILTAEAVQAMYAKFATGTSEERLSNLEIMIKALMDSNFGYQIRQGQENAAIEAYKNSLIPMQSAITAQAEQYEAATKKIAKQDEIITGLFELTEKLAEIPSEEPKTLSGFKKEQFERAQKKEDAMKNIADAITQMKKK